MKLKHLKVGRRFQIQGGKYTFMKVALSRQHGITQNHNEGTPVLNMSNGTVFSMRSDTDAICP